MLTVISSIVLLVVTGHYECVRWRMRYDLMMKLVRPGLLYLTTCLRLRGMLAGLSLPPPLPAPPVPTNINIITIGGTHAAAYTSLHLTGTTMFSLNMRGLCHASVDTVYRRDSVLCHCHPSDNWPECQLLFIRVHQSLYITITQWYIALFQFSA